MGRLIAHAVIIYLVLLASKKCFSDEWHLPTEEENDDPGHSQNAAESQFQETLSGNSNASSNKLTLLVMGELERFSILSGEGADDVPVDLSRPTKRKEHLRFAGKVVCLHKEKVFSDTRPMEALMRNSVKEVVVRTEYLGGSSSMTMSEEDVNGVIYYTTSVPEKDSSTVLIVKHNCTPSGAVAEHRFNLSSVRGKPYALIGQGLQLFPISNDAEFASELSAKRLESQYLRRTGRYWPDLDYTSIPKSIFVQGGFAGHLDEHFDYSKGYRLVGRLYNWDFDSMPEVQSEKPEQFFADSVPLHFIGKIQPENGVNQTCQDLKISIHNNGVKIIEGSSSHDGSINLLNVRGILLDFVDVESAYFTLEHACNPEGERKSEKYKLKTKQVKQEFNQGLKFGEYISQ